MRKFEYMTISSYERDTDSSRSDKLNEFGAEGWEMVSAIWRANPDRIDFFMKRETTMTSVNIAPMSDADLEKLQHIVNSGRNTYIMPCPDKHVSIVHTPDSNMRETIK